jgi:hypothetical protein
LSENREGERREIRLLYYRWMLLQSRAKREVSKRPKDMEIKERLIWIQWLEGQEEMIAGPSSLSIPCTVPDTLEP